MCKRALFTTLVALSYSYSRYCTSSDLRVLLLIPTYKSRPSCRSSSSVRNMSTSVRHKTPKSRTCLDIPTQTLSSRCQLRQNTGAIWRRQCDLGPRQALLFVSATSAIGQHRSAISCKPTWCMSLHKPRLDINPFAGDRYTASCCKIHWECGKLKRWHEKMWQVIMIHSQTLYIAENMQPTETRNTLTA